MAQNSELRTLQQPCNIPGFSKNFFGHKKTAPILFVYERFSEWYFFHFHMPFSDYYLRVNGWMDRRWIWSDQILSVTNILFQDRAFCFPPLCYLSGYTITNDRSHKRSLQPLMLHLLLRLLLWERLSFSFPPLFVLICYVCVLITVLKRTRSFLQLLLRRVQRVLLMWA